MLQINGGADNWQAISPTREKTSNVADKEGSSCDLIERLEASKAVLDSSGPLSDAVLERHAAKNGGFVMTRADLAPSGLGGLDEHVHDQASLAGVVTAGALGSAECLASVCPSSSLRKCLTRTTTIWYNANK